MSNIITIRCDFYDTEEKINKVEKRKTKLEELGYKLVNFSYTHLYFSK